MPHTPAWQIRHSSRPSPDEMASWFTPAEQNGDELALRLGSPVLLPLAQALDFTFGLPSYGALSTAAGCAPAAALTGLDAFWSHASLEGARRAQAACPLKEES